MLGIGRIGETRLQFSHPHLFLKKLFSLKKKKNLNGACYDALPFILCGKKKKKHIKVEILGACAFTLVLMHF